MTKDLKSSDDESKKAPRISKFANSEPALPTGKSSIEIIKNTDPRDLRAATEDANQELSKLVSNPGDTPLEPVSEAHDSIISEQSDEPVGESPAVEEIPPFPEVPDEPANVLNEQDQEIAEDDEPKDPNGSGELEELIDGEDGLPNDPVTNRAVEEIIAEEGDKVLAAEDRKLEQEAQQDKEHKSANTSGLLSRLWYIPATRYGLIGGTFLSLLLLALIPYSRYFVLNTAGVRSSLELSVIDETTLQPLKNVSVSAGGANSMTDSDGNVHLNEVKLGKTKLVIDKRAFSKIEQNIVIGWGSNPLGEFKANAVGAQYSFIVKDYLSGKPIDGAEAVSGDGNASSDVDGKIILTLDTANQEDTDQIIVDITADNYRKETINLTVNNKEAQSVELVPSRKHAFVSKRSGKYDVYTADIDGKNEQKIVSGTGLERDDIALIPHQKDSYAALVSTRERVLNDSGYLLSTLYIVDTNSGDLTKIDQSERIQVIGWSAEGRLIYVKVASGASAIDPKRHRLMSFNADDFSDTKELAASNAFNDVMMAEDRVYYAPSNIFQESANPGVYVIDANGQNLQTLLDKEAFALQRSSYGVIDLSVGETWYTFAIGSKDAPVPGQPAVAGVSRLYADNPNNKFSLWVDDRDGKGVLLNYDVDSKEDKLLASRSGLRTPVYWLNDKVAIFRVKDSRETADYAISIDGGEARKIIDVTDSAGVARWYYY